MTDYAEESARALMYARAPPAPAEGHAARQPPEAAGPETYAGWQRPPAPAENEMRPDGDCIVKEGTVVWGKAAGEAE